MKFSKMLAVCAMSVALAFSAAVVTGCAQSDEDVIRDGVKAELDSIKNLDDEFLNMLAADTGSDEFAAYGIDTTEFMKSYLDGFDYKIDSITVNGESADVVVTLTCKSFSNYMQQVDADANAYAQELVSDPDKVEGMTEEEINAAIGQIIIDALAKVEVAQTSPITVTYEKVDGNWQGAANTEDIVANALLSN